MNSVGNNFRLNWGFHHVHKDIYTWYGLSFCIDQWWFCRFWGNGPITMCKNRGYRCLDIFSSPMKKMMQSAQTWFWILLIILSFHILHNSRVIIYTSEKWSSEGRSALRLRMQRGGFDSRKGQIFFLFLWLFLFVDPALRVSAGVWCTRPSQPLAWSSGGWIQGLLEHWCTIVLHEARLQNPTPSQVFLLVF